MTVTADELRQQALQAMGVVELEQVLLDLAVTEQAARTQTFDEREVGTLAGEFDGDATADAPARTGDQRDLVEQWRLDGSGHFTTPFS